MTEPAAWVPPPDVEPRDVPLDEMISELKREMAMRKGPGGFPRFVSDGKMKASAADSAWSRMQAALRTLIWVQENDRTIRNAVTHEKALKAEEAKAGLAVVAGNTVAEGHEALREIDR